MYGWRRRRRRDDDQPGVVNVEREYEQQVHGREEFTFMNDGSLWGRAFRFVAMHYFN